MATLETKSLQEYRRDYDAVLRKLKAGKEHVLVDPRRITDHIQHYVGTMDDTGYCQWEKCRKAFKQARGQSNIDALKLASELEEYLARFGMLRGKGKSFFARSSRIDPGRVLHYVTRI